MEDELEVEVEVLDPAMEQVIDAELSPFNRDELAGIWRSLCAMMLLRTANLLHCHHHDRKQNATQRQTALRWMNNGTGIITFRSACETLELDEEYAKTGLLRHAETRAKPPINREKSGLIFGKYEPCHLSRKKSPSFSSGPQFSTT
jgi:hypothetical protein